MADFDLSSAEPVGQSASTPGDFDIGSAQPVDPTAPSFRTRYGTGISLDATSGGIVPTHSPQSAAAYSPVAGNSFLQNADIGVGKLYTDALLGARQLYAQASGGDESTVVDPVTGQTAAQKRGTDAPVSSTWGGRVGEIAGALPLGYLAPSVGGAALLGAGTGAVQPTVGNESRLLNTGVGAGVGAAGQAVGNSVTGWLTSRAAQPFMGWSPTLANRVAARAVGSDAKVLDQKAIGDATDRIGAVFDQARSPNVSTQLGNQTVSQIDTAGQGLNRSTRTAFENNDNVADLLDLAANNKPATAQQLGQLSSKLGADARAQMTSKDGDRALGQALFSMKDHVDDLVGSTITDPALATAYGTARTQYRALSQLTTNPTILNSATGEVNMTALGKMLQRTDKPGYLRGGNQSDLYNAARWGQATGQGPGAPPLALGENLGLPLIKYYGLNNPVSRAIGGAVSRAGAPVAPLIGQGASGAALGASPWAGYGLNSLVAPYFSK